MNDFYITLPFNQKDNLYDNHLNNFSTDLIKDLDTKHKEIGLAELHIVMNKKEEGINVKEYFVIRNGIRLNEKKINIIKRNVPSYLQDSKYSLVLSDDGKSLCYSVNIPLDESKIDSFDSFYQILTENLAKEEFTKNHIMSYYDPRVLEGKKETEQDLVGHYKDYSFINIPGNKNYESSIGHAIEISFTNRMTYLLDLENEKKNLINFKRVVNPAKFEAKLLKERENNLVHICTNSVEKSILGETTGQVLRTVNIIRNKDHSYIFNNIHYIRAAYLTTRRVNITFLDNERKLFPFYGDNGQIVIKLHVKDITF